MAFAVTGCVSSSHVEHYGIVRQHMWKYSIAALVIMKIFARNVLFQLLLSLVLQEVPFYYSCKELTRLSINEMEQHAHADMCNMLTDVLAQHCSTALPAQQLTDQHCFDIDSRSIDRESLCLPRAAFPLSDTACR